MPLAGVVALDAMGLVLADVEPSWRDRCLIDCPIVGAVEARVPELQAGEESFQRGAIATAAFPVNQSA